MSYANYHLPISHSPTSLLRCLVSLCIILHTEVAQKTVPTAPRAQALTQLRTIIIWQRYPCGGC